MTDLALDGRVQIAEGACHRLSTGRGTGVLRLHQVPDLRASCLGRTVAMDNLELIWLKA